MSSLSLADWPGSKASTTSSQAGFIVNVINKSEPLKPQRRARAFWRFFCINCGPDVKVAGKITLPPIEEGSSPSWSASISPLYNLAHRWELSTLAGWVCRQCFKKSQNVSHFLILFLWNIWNVYPMSGLHPNWPVGTRSGKWRGI